MQFKNNIIIGSLFSKYQYCIGIVCKKKKHDWDFCSVQDDVLLNDSQTLGNCGFTNQTARPQAPATVGLAFRLAGKKTSVSLVHILIPKASFLIWYLVSSSLCHFSCHVLPSVSSSQMIPLSSWGLSPSPLPQSFLTSWSPRTRAVQPMSRLFSEGRGGFRRVTHRGSEGGRDWILGGDASVGTSFADPSLGGHKQLHGLPLL